MAAKRPKPVDIDEIHLLLERTTNILKKEKKAKKAPVVCKGCGGMFIYSKNLCKACYELERNERITENMTKRWFSSNGHEYTYNEEGAVVSYARYRMETLLGRPLQEYEIVARVDGDKKNNADHNLYLVIKPGVNLMGLECSCGRHYLDVIKERYQPHLELHPDQDIS